MVRMRYDMFICFLISSLLLVAINAIGDKYVEARIAASEEEKIISADEIGGQADDSIPIAKSIADMEELDRFTVELDSDADDDGYVYVEDHLWRIIELEESGEYILADVYQPSVQYISDEDSMWGWGYTKLYPVGELVKREITQDIIDDAKEDGYELTVTDCYIDMANGNNAKYDPTVAENVTVILMVVIPVCVFIFLHILGVRIGVFPPIIPRRG